MLNSQRSFIKAIRKYGADHDIEVTIRSEGWLVVMQRGGERRFALGYDLGLNSAVAHRIANDKAATSDVLDICGIPHVPHTLFLGPRMYKYIPPANAWQQMLDLLRANPNGIVVKPNEGTGGNSVFRARNDSELERAAHEIFLTENSLAISPYLAIEDEVRVVLIDDQPIVVYSKQRPSVTGDGKHSLHELIAATLPAVQVPGALRAAVEGAALDEVVPAGERRILNWRHNLDAGAQPVLLEQGAARDACVRIAREAANAIGIRFASIDVVRVEGRWRVLEINSGVMMEALGKSHPELVEAAYGAALAKVFESK